jgi:ATP-dependent exoDNAse (exonuclease V) beta subunit
LHALDDDARRRALDPSQSFTVRAPAGSGKTELLIQRFLGLLATVRRPESIVAITFTRKAAGEMLERIMGALHDASAATAVAEPHLEITRDLALRALARDRELAWNLLEHPGRLRVQTIDSLCMSIVGEMPWLARLGAMPRIEEDAGPLYEEAARLTLLDETAGYQDALTTLLRHLDNSAAQARGLISTMLARRDQWLNFLHLEAAEERAAMEETLRRTIVRGLAKADRLVPESLRADWRASARFAAANLGEAPDDSPLGTWRSLCNVVLTGEDKWRKQLTKTCGFPTQYPTQKQAGLKLIAALQEKDGLLEALQAVRKLPPAQFTDAQWEVLRAFLQTLRLAVGQLKLTFQERRVIDFIELGQAALQALGGVDRPSELAFHLDARIEHLLVDEFQDTSRMQFELIERLTTGWEPGDGRTLFIVGDPMQSIYRFRQAEVGLFLEVEQSGIGGLPLAPIELQLNRRSRLALVDCVNELLKPSFPGDDDTETGAIKFTRSRAAQTEAGGEVTFDGFLEHEDAREAACAVRRIQAARLADPAGSIAILVRARTHLFAITEALKQAAIPYEAVDIEPLADRTIVRDLLALTRALLNPTDRVAWLAVLRAPWCGLALGDLEALVKDRLSTPIEECLADLSGLSEDGQARAARVRDVLAGAIAEQGRWPLRRRLERTWIQLGGPACLRNAAGADERALEDAAAYLDRLEAEQTGADLGDLGQFRARLTGLYSKPRTSAPGAVQVMTIHKAKGLEFDTVIVPGLGRLPRIDDPPLILFHEWRSAHGFECLLAPIDETRAEKTPLYAYLRDLEKRKNDLERARQLYVAATRARQRLHLLGQVVLNPTGEPRAHSRSMLADLWGKLTPEQQASYRNSAAQNTGGVAAPGVMKKLHRLPASWSLPEAPAPVVWDGAGKLRAESHEPTFEWVSESLRHTGTVVHAFLQRMPAEAAVSPPGLHVIRKAVAHAGVIPADIESAAQRAQQAILGVLHSPRGQWILAPHAGARSEYAVTGLVDGEIVRGTVDRTFVENGARWIIDFKTSTHEGGSLRAFLDEQQRRYRDQMERYARILAPLGEPVRLGLYFPLLDEWREWAPESA